MKVALVHDWMNQIGGAEDVLEALVELFPDAPIYTSLYAPDRMPTHWQNWDIRTNFIDKLPFSHRKQQLYFPLYPYSFEQHDLRGYDLVISNKSGFCHGIGLGAPRPLHVCYCLTPTLFLWLYEQYREREQIGGVVNALSGFQAPNGMSPAKMQPCGRWGVNCARSSAGTCEQHEQNQTMALFPHRPSHRQTGRWRLLGLFRCPASPGHWEQRHRPDGLVLSSCHR